MFSRHPQFIWFFLAIWVIACNPINDNRASETTSPDTNSYAKLFQLSYRGQDTLLHIYNLSNQIVVRYFWGKSDHIDAYQKITQGQRIITLSAIFARMLHQLNATKRIIGVDNIDYYPRDLPIDPGLTSFQLGGNLNHEKLAQSQPDWVLTYYLQDTDRKQWERYQQSSIQVIYLQCHQEKHPLGRAEWIRPLAHMMGIPKKGDSIFREIKLQYERNRKVASPKKKKTMLNIPFEGIWYIPPGDSYTDQLLIDAGHQPAWELQTSQTSTRVISMEQAVSYLGKSGFWLNVGSVKHRQDISHQEPRLTPFTQNTNLRIFQPDKLLEPNGANAYWDLGAVRPDLILKDLIKIQQETSLDSLVFYRELR